MTQIVYGYGSEFQLMRFLGHHRNLLENEIKKQIGVEGEIHWLDFGFSNSESCVSGDDEIKGLNFLVDIPFVSDIEYMAADAEYYMYEINNQASWQCWDAVFTLNDTIYLVEAKAHVGELSSGNETHGGVSANEIKRFMKDQLPEFNITEEWMKEYYQLGNRLATTALLNRNGIKAKTLCLFFENGYRKKAKVNGKLTILSDKDASREDFEKAIKIEMDILGINHEMVSHLMAPNVFINANPNKSNL